jgi:heme-degrading monooxygenase HmoA
MSRAAEEYSHFAQRNSVPMFRAQPGFDGVLFAAKDGERAVITLWEDRTSVEALDNSDSYTTTVAAIEAAGFLEGKSTVEIFELEAAVLEQELVRRVQGMRGTATTADSN